MTHRRFPRNLFQGTDQPGSGDGQDPRFDRTESHRTVPNRKSLQLAKQIMETLTLVLAGQEDDLLRDLWVESVRPFPTSARMLVTLIPAISSDSLNIGLALDRILAIQGNLRIEVAASISRRKVPDLVFRVLKADDPRL